MHILFKNKKINLNHIVIERIEAGISLKGYEVKSIVKANANIDQAFIVFKHNEAYLLNMYVAPYNEAANVSIVADRTRKLLLNKNQIIRLQQQIKKERLACIPSIVYLKNNKIKIEFALCKSKNAHDKRETIKERDLKREMKKY